FMIKSELILRIAAQNPHLYRKDVEAVVDAILGRISDGLLAGDRVELRRFGTLWVRERGVRFARNPKTGTRVSVAGKKNITFKPSKGMRACLNRSPSTAEPLWAAEPFRLPRLSQRRPRDERSSAPTC
ncbi:HU family DNA-binding protein, partial [Streptomyces globisporus]|uniref:HU family DNA-binding protein n=3 Tax=Bacteria TaxID=2 RepID=UPI0036F4E201